MLGSPYSVAKRARRPPLFPLAYYVVEAAPTASLASLVRNPSLAALAQQKGDEHSMR